MSLVVGVRRLLLAHGSEVLLAEIGRQVEAERNAAVATLREMLAESKRLRAEVPVKVEQLPDGYFSPAELRALEPIVDFIEPAA